MIPAQAELLCGYPSQSQAAELLGAATWLPVVLPRGEAVAFPF